MTTRIKRVAAGLVLCASASPALAQSWRHTAATLGGTTRVLIIGARPEDEDNALIAWLSLGRNVETAYLSLTRGESAPNLIGGEQQAALAVVRTAELLAERERDGAHQYFTRAYDFGHTKSDSITNAAWPHDSLLGDVLAVVRAFRPHVMISAISDSGERDATRRVAAQLAREAYALSGQSDSAVSRAIRGKWALPPWRVSRLLTLLPADNDSASLRRVDVGELDRQTGRSYAEIGADIRRLQRTQPAPPAPSVGHVWRLLRVDSARVGGDGVFGDLDTTWSRFRGAGSDTVMAAVDALHEALDAAHASALRGASGDSVASALARVLRRVDLLRETFQCTSSTVLRCGGPLVDLTLTAERVRSQATTALLDAAGIVIDGTVERELVAAGDSVPVTVTLRNGGSHPITIRRVAADSRTALTLLARDSSILLPDSVATWSGSVRVRSSDLHWWQVNGLMGGTYLHALPAAPSALIAGEDRLPRSGVEMTLGIDGVDFPILHRPLVHRDLATVRGDARHPLAGVTPLSVLLERIAEYERATIPIDRLFRVFLASAQTSPDTVSVTLQPPRGVRVDSATRTVIVPPLGNRNVFFRLRGTMRAGTDSILASAGPPGSDDRHVASAQAREFDTRRFTYGSITHEYPHIPAQQFIRSSKERIEAVDLRVPPLLRIAYVKGSDDVQTPLGQLQVNAHAIEPSLLSVVDLSFYTTILIGANAFANDALAGAVPSLRDFMRNGGTVVALASGPEIASSGLLPYPVTFDSTTHAVANADAPVHITDAHASFLMWPNAITAADFDNWSAGRARSVPLAFDPRYRAPLTTGDPDDTPTAATLLTARVGHGTLVYTSLSLDRELNAAHPGAARLLVNLLSAGLQRGAATAR